MDRAEALVEIPDKIRPKPSPRLQKSPASIRTIRSRSRRLYMAAFASLKQKQYEPATRLRRRFYQTLSGRRADRRRAIRTRPKANCNWPTTRTRPAQLAELIAAHPKHRDAEQWKVRRRPGPVSRQEIRGDGRRHRADRREPTSKPLRAEALFLLGSAQNELKQPGSAVRSLTASLAADPHWNQADETLLALGAGAAAIRRHRQRPAGGWSNSPSSIPRAARSIARIFAWANWRTPWGTGRRRARIQADGR